MKSKRSYYLYFIDSHLRVETYKPDGRLYWRVTAESRAEARIYFRAGAARPAGGHYDQIR